MTLLESTLWDDQLCGFTHREILPARIRTDVAKYLKTCHRCKTVKFFQLQKANHALHPISVPIWHQIGIDIIDTVHLQFVLPLLGFCSW